MIDEIPVLRVLGAVSEEGLIVRDAGELRVKETDRIETIARNLRRMGATVTTTEDGLEIPGRQKFHAGRIRIVRRSSHRHGVFHRRARLPMVPASSKMPKPHRSLSRSFTRRFDRSRR